MELIQAFREMIEAVDKESKIDVHTSFCPENCDLKISCEQCPMDSPKSRAKALELLDALEPQYKMIKLLKE